MKKTIALLILLLSVATAFSQSFKINGTANGLENGTWLYLETASPQQNIDSAQVNQGKFVLTGQLPEMASNVLLRTAKFSNYVFFWLENKTINISLTNGQFKKALIEGSATQTENELIVKIIEPFNLKKDSLGIAINKTTDPAVKADLRKQLASVKLQEYTTYLNYAKAHPNSLIIANIANIYSSTWGREKIKAIFDLLDPTILQTKYGKNISDFIRLNRDIQIGGKFVDFEQTNAQGKKIKLSDVKAKYILLEFWGSWCGPCREENPELVKTYHIYNAKGFEIFGVAADNNKAQWLKAIKDDGLPWINVTDLKGDKNEAGMIYGINAYPTNFLIDQTGTIIAKNLSGKRLAEKLAELLP